MCVCGPSQGADLFSGKIIFIELCVHLTLLWHLLLAQNAPFLPLRPPKARCARGGRGPEFRDAVCVGASIYEARARAEPLAFEYAPALGGEDTRAQRAQSGEGVERFDSGSGGESRRMAGRRGSRNPHVHR
ncbi:hypothetical protein DFH11DRAFT_113380 [Phellopilus nigrolimitatus]|nr:hypothetical protein DFH11DRAFT_113380 [Phellopilus nigrolimitatus]